MTYNIHHGRGEDDVVNLDRIAQVIQDMDIALVNEVDINWSRSGFTDQARDLAIKAGFEYYAFSPSLVLPQVGRESAQYGNVVLSRHPIVSATRYALPRPPGREPRTALTVEVNIAGTIVTFISTHLGLNAEERLAQSQELMALIAQFRGPVILAGDLNAFSDSPEVKRIASVMHDTYQRAEDNTDGLTFPNPNPTARIDYIFVSPDLFPHVVTHHVPKVSGSDHLPVIAHIDWACYKERQATTTCEPPMD